jgi:hypothetical protein
MLPYTYSLMFKQHRTSTSCFELCSYREERNAQVPVFPFPFCFLLPHFKASHYTVFYQGIEVASGERCFILRLIMISSIRKTLE